MKNKKSYHADTLKLIEITTVLIDKEKNIRSLILVITRVLSYMQKGMATPHEVAELEEFANSLLVELKGLEETIDSLVTPFIKEQIQAEMKGVK